MKAILWYHLTFWLTIQGRSQDFSKGGGVTLCQSEGTHQIVMSTSTPYFGLMWHVSDVVGLVKKGLQKGGSRAPQDPPGYALAIPWRSHLKIELSEYLPKAEGIAEAVTKYSNVKQMKLTSCSGLLPQNSICVFGLPLQLQSRCFQSSQYHLEETAL